jgi:hypothetical protein
MNNNNTIALLNSSTKSGNMRHQSKQPSNHNVSNRFTATIFTWGTSENFHRLHTISPPKSSHRLNKVSSCASGAQRTLTA